MPTGIQPFLFFAEPVASLTHLAGAVAACVAMVFLLREVPCESRVAVSVFALSVIGLLATSGLYHLFPTDSAPRSVLRRFDHAGIWIATAGCATALWQFLLKGKRVGTPFLVGVWLVALTGAGLKTFYLDAIPDRFGVLLFVAYGALGIPVVLWLVGTRGLRYARWFFCCGVALSVGALLEMIEEPMVVSGVIGYHEVVHLFVMGGLFFHWAFVRQLAREAVGRESAPAETGAAALTV